MADPLRFGNLELPSHYLLSPLAGCMYGKMQTVAFPKFNGQKTHASFSLALK